MSIGPDKAFTRQDDYLYVLDLDRCLTNDNLYTLFEDVITTIPEIDLHKMKRERASVEGVGGSFDMLSWLAASMTHRAPRLFEKITSLYLERAKQQGPSYFRGTGATELLAYFDANSLPYMILTYGGAQYQALKIRAAGYALVPYMVTDTTNKSKVMQSWYGGEETQFMTPILSGGEQFRAGELVLVDDKYEAFHDLPHAATGYWINSSSSAVLPKGVIQCSTLLDVLKHESHSIDI